MKLTFLFFVEGDFNDYDKDIQTIYEFYKAYILACDGPPDAIAELNALKNKYLTPKLLDRLSNEDWGFDPIINAQDCDASWIETLKVVRLPIYDNLYEVYYYTDENNKVSIRLSLEDTEGVYLINDILTIDW